MVVQLGEKSAKMGVFSRTMVRMSSTMVRKASRTVRKSTKKNALTRGRKGVGCVGRGRSGLVRLFLAEDGFVVALYRGGDQSGTSFFAADAEGDKAAANAGVD